MSNSLRFVAALLAVLLIAGELLPVEGQRRRMKRGAPIVVVTPMISVLTQGIKDSQDGNGITTDPNNITGATLIVVYVCTYPGSSERTPTDSTSNTYTALTDRTTGGNAGGRFWYKASPVTSSSWTLSVAGTENFPTAGYVAFTGTHTTPFDVENGAASAGVLSLATGSITPTQNNEVVVAGGCSTANQPGGISVNESMSTQAVVTNTPGGYTMLLATKIQTTATAINPTFTFTTSGNIVVGISSFKVAP